MSMKGLRNIPLLLPIIILLSSEAMAADLDAKVKAEVIFSAETGIYTYRYTILSQPSSRHSIQIFEIDNAKPTSGLDLPTKGLMILESFHPSDSEKPYDAFVIEQLRVLPDQEADKRIVPAGFRPPKNWTAGYTIYSSINWTATVPLGGSQYLIHPGETKEGFELTSYGLPGIRAARISPSVDIDPLIEEGFKEAYKTTSPEEMTDDQAFEISKKAMDSVALHQATLGPTAPPKKFVSLDFISYLIGLRTQAQTQGWVTNSAANITLDKKLNAIKNDLGAKNKAAALTHLTEFINEVENQKAAGLSSEGYALLKYNALYLQDNLLKKNPTN